MSALKKTIGSILLCSFLFNFGIDADLNKESSRLFDNFRRAKNKTALVSNDNNNVFGVGYSIDVVKSKYLDAEDVKDGAPMLDEDWLKNTLANQSVKPLLYSDSFSMSDNSFESLLSSFDAKFSFSSNIGGTYDVFTANLSTSSNIEKLKSYFRSYASRYYSDVNYNYYTSSELFVPEHRDDLEYFDSLNCEGTVYTREGLQSDPLVWFDLDNGKGDYTCRFIRAFGYKRAHVSLYMDIKEINDGYQYIHLYYGPKDSYRCLGEKRYEHVPGKLDTEYSQAVIGFDIKLSDLNEIDDKYENKLFFYFSESGYGENDWKYRDPRVLVTYYKE